jgi:formylmethanofuran dehydrogenase subunit E
MLYFSLFSGELFSSDETINDPHQIPLKQRPNSSCKKCYGRFYTSYNTTTKQFIVCPKCLAKCLDENYILDYLKQKSNGKKNS